MGIPTANPIIKPILDDYYYVDTPLVTTLDDPTVNEPTVEVEPNPDDRDEEAAVVDDALPLVVDPVPLTTTDPTVKLSNVIASTNDVLKFINPNNQVTN